MANTQIEKEIYSFIKELIQENSKITPREVYTLLSDKFLDPNDTKYPFDFAFAYFLDNKFFGVGGGRWLAAYSMPKESQIIQKDGFKYLAIRCGIFTFTLLQIVEYIY